MIDFRVALPSDSSLGRILRLPLRLIPPGAVLPILSGPLKGLKWVARAGNHGCWMGTYELDTQQRIVQEAPGCDIAFDLGANHGFFTMLLARYCRVVVAVEASAPNVAVLERHLGINGVRNCKILHAAAGKENGLSFFAEGPNHATGRVSAEGGMEVNLVSLEELVKRFGPASVIKMDVEGAEFEVLEGGADYLRERRPKLFVSTHSDNIREDCVRLLRSLDFSVRIYEYDLVTY